MDVYYPINAVMLAVSVWALWVRRMAWHSAWDRPMNISIAFQVLGTVLTSRAPAVRSFFESLLGREFILLSGALTYMAAVVFAILAVYKRLMSDRAITSFMANRVLWPAAAAWVVMIASFALSASARRHESGRFLYLLAGRDGWLKVYQTIFLVTMLYLLILVKRGMTELRDQRPDDFDIAYMLWSWVAIMTAAVQIIGLFIDVSAGMKYGSELCDVASALMALGAGRSWLKRVRPPVRSPHRG